MLEQIAQLVKQYGQQSVVDNPQVPNDLNSQVMAEATSTITGGLQNIFSGGGLGGLIDLIGGNKGQQSQQGAGGLLRNPIVAMMVGHLANNLVKKMGLSPAVASNISNNIIPGVINSFTQKTVSNAPEDDNFDLNDLVSAFTGGNASQSSGGLDFQDILNQLTRGQQVQVDQNVVDQITQQAQQAQQQKNQGGGLADLIQGFFK